MLGTAATTHQKKTECESFIKPLLFLWISTNITQLLIIWWIYPNFVKRKKIHSSYFCNKHLHQFFNIYTYIIHTCTTIMSYRTMMEVNKFYDVHRGIIFGIKNIDAQHWPRITPIRLFQMFSHKMEIPWVQ